jgi:hypothetical protein
MDVPASRLDLRVPVAGAVRERTALATVAMVAGGYVVGRLIVLVAAVFSETLLIRNPSLTSGDGSFLLRALTSWDGWWYLGIARDGYHLAPIQGPYHDYAFLPFFPALIRLVAAPFPGAEGLVAVLLSHALFAVALGLLFLLGRRHLGERRAAVACFLIGISPFSVMFSMAYGESLFLALSVGAFLAAERGHRPLAGILLALSAVARLQGAVLALPLWLLMLRQDGWRPRPSQLWVLLGPLAVAAFLGWVAWFTGSAGAYAANQAEWGRGVIGSLDPSQTIAATFNPIQVALLLILCATIWPLVYARVDGLRLEHALIPVLFLAATFVSGNLESVGRYATAAFPIFWLLANRRSTFWRRVWPAMSAGLLGVFALLSFGGYWAP